MRRIAIFTYGIACYAAFLAVFLYAIGFVGNFGVRASLDAPASMPWTTALLIDTSLLGAFALQHSLMARRWFKRWITRIIPAPAERSTYVLASSLALALLFWQWQPLGGVIWEVQSAAGRMFFHIAFAFGWVLVLVATFAISHFDLFGLRQVWRELLGRAQAPLPFSTPVLYRIVRHPLYVGWFFVFWSAPLMTASHLFFAIMTTLYILIAIRFEEADLMREHPDYARYRAAVPMLVPALKQQPIAATAESVSQ